MRSFPGIAGGTTHASGGHGTGSFVARLKGGKKKNTEPHQPEHQALLTEWFSIVLSGK